MSLRALALFFVLVGCDADSLVPPDVTDSPDVPDNCPVLFAQNVMPEYRVVISATEWAAMEDEFANVVAREAAGLDTTPYHPVEVEYLAGDERFSIQQTLLRLKGQSSWRQTIALDPNPKMQFVLAFNEIDPEGRFMGVRKVELDMPRSDKTFMQQRAGLYAMRAAGVPAQCANNARLTINGEYYGLYTHLERLDKEFIQRNFGAEDDGDLWKNGRTIKTNEETFTWDRLSALWAAQTATELDLITDLDASVYEWAVEAMIGDADGEYNGRANFFLYDHPSRGFIWLPSDLDTVLNHDYLPVESSPVIPDCVFRWELDWIHYLMVVNDPAWVETYVTALATARATFDTGRLVTRLGQWQTQIATAADQDPHRRFSMEESAEAVTRTQNYVGDRAAYVDLWLACRDHGGLGEPRCRRAVQRSRRQLQRPNRRRRGLRVTWKYGPSTRSGSIAHVCARVKSTAERRSARR